jgi:hypothetical protein
MNERNSYGMFTEEGDLIIGAIVAAARVYRYEWCLVDHLLDMVADIKGFEEATDTEVREAVYVALH